MAGKRVVAAALVAGLACPALAWADKTIEAAPPDRFVTTDVTMDQGERLVFHNGDTVTHDVTATQKGPDGKPLFATPPVDGGKEAFVEGSQYLTAGHYDFICSIHPNMKGMLHVTTNGTPQQRPGSSGPSATAVDQRAPALGVALVSRGVAVARTRNALRVRISVDESAHVMLRAVARPHAGGPLVTVARGDVHMMQPGTRRISVPLTRAGRAAVRRHRALAVIVTGRATDAAGNVTTQRSGRTLRA